MGEDSMVEEDNKLEDLVDIGPFLRGILPFVSCPVCGVEYYNREDPTNIHENSFPYTLACGLTCCHEHALKYQECQHPIHHDPDPIYPNFALVDLIKNIFNPDAPPLMWPDLTCQSR